MPRSRSRCRGPLDRGRRRRSDWDALLRPKAGENQAHFYTLVSGETVEQDFALKRQLFLCEQGYE